MAYALRMESEIGNIVRQRREELRLTVRELAERVGISAGYLTQIETGKVGIPSPDVMARLAKALHVAEIELVRAVGFLREEHETLLDTLDNPQSRSLSDEEWWLRIVAHFGGDERAAHRWIANINRRASER